MVDYATVALHALAMTLSSSLAALALTLPLCMQDTEPEEQSFPTIADLDIAARVLGLEFSEAEREQMRERVIERLEELERVRNFAVRWDTPMALGFSPLMPGMEPRNADFEASAISLPEVTRPADLNELAFADIATLAALIKSRQVSCVELAELFLGRLEDHDESLNCVVSLTRERAVESARALDAELERGEWRGLLHGIPYGAKDLLAARGAPTTWGAKPFEAQVQDLDATVITKLEEAGCVLVAKLSLGALAMGDEWFRGRTNNPWNPTRGSSGSSAGPAAATAAGLVPFAIGSETLGSIISPSMRCGNSSLRPTFGRVGRGGAMPLSWSMDKLGPMGRSAADMAIVFDVLHGADDVDLDAVTRPFELSGAVDVTGWRVGYLSEQREDNASYATNLEELESLGVELVAIELPEYPVWDMMLILMAEAAAAFDELTRDGRDDQLVQQGDQAWPNLFRAARLIPAVEYVRANRLRAQLCREMHGLLADVELYVHPPFGSDSLGITNLTGHPCFIAPSSEPKRERQPETVCFTGQLYGEARLLALVQAWQAATDYEEARPPGF